MGIPVKLKIDGFIHLGETFNKGDIFNAPHEAFASFLCDQEKQATRVDESKLEPEQAGTMKRVMKGGSYNTKVMSPDDSSDGKPVVTKTETKSKTETKPKTEAPKVAPKSKSNVKAKSDASSENT